MFVREIGATVETELDRQARMRDRAKVLREKREEERQRLAESKKYQQWMVNCEELRTMRSKLEHEACAPCSSVLLTPIDDFRGPSGTSPGEDNDQGPRGPRFACEARRHQ
jgi:hypothetical protein